MLEDEGVEKFIASWHDLQGTVKTRARGRAPRPPDELRHPPQRPASSPVAEATLPELGLLEPRRASASPRGDASLVGPGRPRTRPSRRLGWVEAVAVSRPLRRPRSLASVERLRAAGVDRDRARRGWAAPRWPRGHRRAPTACALAVILDSTAPGQVLVHSTATRRPATDAPALVVVASPAPPSRPTAKRVYEAGAPRTLGIDPLERIVVVTDPGSPLDQAALRGRLHASSTPDPDRRRPLLGPHRVRPACPAGLARRRHRRAARRGGGDARSSSPIDEPTTLASCSARRSPDGEPRAAKDKLGLIADGTHIVGLRRLGGAARSPSRPARTGTRHPAGRPRCRLPRARRRTPAPTCRSCASSATRPGSHPARRRRRGRASPDSLGAQFLVWEYATAIAGRMLGINPFDQPDVGVGEDRHARAIWTPRPEHAAPARSAWARSRCARPAARLGGHATLEGARRRAAGRASARPTATWPIQAYRRPARPAAGLAGPARAAVAADSGAPSRSAGDRGSCTRPGQYHRQAAPRSASFLQIIDARPTSTSRSPAGRSPSASCIQRPGRRRCERARRPRPTRRACTSPHPRARSGWLALRRGAS